jgi:outer membrane receptor protein involved in Fe transport
VFNAAPGERLFLRDWKYGTGTGVQLEEKVTYRALDELVFVGGAAVYHRNILPKASVNRSDEAEIDADEIGADTSVDILSQGQSFSWFEDSADERVSVSNYTLFVYQNYAAYLEGQWDATPQLTVVGGLRVDKDSRYDDLPLSPRVAAIFHANENLAIKGIYTQAFVNPAPYFSFASFNGTNFNVPNPDLKPELAQSIELNTSYTLSWLLSGLSVYYNLQDRILFHADDGLRFQLLRDGQGDPNDSDPSARPVYRNVDEDGNLIDPAGVSQSVNGGESSAFGFDLYGKLRLDLASLWASYSYVNFESKDTDGNTVGLDALAEQQVRLGVTMRFFEERLTTTVSGQWSSTLERLDGNNAKADPNDASEVGRLDAEVKNPYSVNAYLSYKVLNELSASLMAKNVTDNRYALKGILGPSPQESIKILAGLRYTLD